MATSKEITFRTPHRNLVVGDIHFEAGVYTTSSPKEIARLTSDFAKNTLHIVAVSE